MVNERMEKVIFTEKSDMAEAKYASQREKALKMLDNADSFLVIVINERGVDSIVAVKSIMDNLFLLNTMSKVSRDLSDSMKDINKIK